MSRSSQAKMHNLPMGAVHWTGGFWGDVFDTMHGIGVWEMWNTWNTPWETLDADGKHGSHGFRNFEVAAGTVKGKHHGPPFHDGDMYKWLEACAAVYAVTKDGELDALMDRFIEQVALAQPAGHLRPGLPAGKPVRKQVRARDQGRTRRHRAAGTLRGGHRHGRRRSQQRKESPLRKEGCRLFV